MSHFTNCVSNNQKAKRTFHQTKLHSFFSSESSMNVLHCVLLCLSHRNLIINLSFKLDLLINKKVDCKPLLCILWTFWNWLHQNLVYFSILLTICFALAPVHSEKYTIKLECSYRKYGRFIILLGLLDNTDSRGFSRVCFSS